jgi:hypothetical protein
MPNLIGPGRHCVAVSLALFAVLLAAVIHPAIACGKPDAAAHKEYEIKAVFIYNFLKFVEWPKEKRVHDPKQITIGIIGEDHFADSFEPFRDKKVRECELVVKRFESYKQLKDSIEAERERLERQLASIRRSYVMVRDEAGRIVVKPVDNMEELQNVANEAERKMKIEQLKAKGLVFVDPTRDANLKVIIDALVQEKLEALKQCHVLFICESEKKHFKEINELLRHHSVLTVSDTNEFLKSGGMINFILERSKVRFEVNLTAAEKAKLDIRSQLLRLAKTVIREPEKKDRTESEKTN